MAGGGPRDRLAGVLDQVTAIVNVPFLKTHNLAGMTCCLKNLSHALVKHPAQFHTGGCKEVADIVVFMQEGLSSNNYPDHTPPELPK